MVKYILKERCEKCGDRLFRTAFNNTWCENCREYKENDSFEKRIEDIDKFNIKNDP